MKGLLFDRLLSASLLLILLVPLVDCLIRLLRIKSSRFCTLLWLIVMIKPLLVIVGGSPLTVPLLYSPDKEINNGIIDFSSTPPLSLSIPLTKSLPQQNKTVCQNPDISRLNGNTPVNIAKYQTPTPVIKGSIAPPIRSHIGIKDWLLYFWLIGAGIMTILFFRGSLAIRKILKNALPTLAPATRCIFRDICHELKIRRIPRLLVSTEIPSPVLIGFLKPVILIPAWLDTGEFGAEMRWIQRHELTHLKRYDPLGLCIRQILTVLFYFHPCSWIAAARWTNAMEQACDDAMITTENEACSYARALYKIVNIMKGKHPPVFANALFATHSRIGRRISSLLSNCYITQRKFNLLQVIFFAVFTIAILSCGIRFSNGEGTKKTPKIPKKPMSKTAKQTKHAFEISKVDNQTSDTHTSGRSHWGLDNRTNSVQFHDFQRMSGNLKIPGQPSIQSADLSNESAKIENAKLRKVVSSTSKNNCPFYQIVVGSNLSSEKFAEGLKNTLEKEEGFTPVDVVRNERNSYDVVLGKFLTENEARQSLNTLELDGYLGTISMGQSEQVPPNETYKILVGTDIEEQKAKDLQKRLKSSGYCPADIIKRPKGYDVRVGLFKTDGEAAEAEKSLKNDGFSIIKRIKDPQKFTILFKEHKNRKWAELLKQNLENDGYCPVRIQESNRTYQVMMGEYTDMLDLENLLSDLQENDYQCKLVPLP